MIISVRIVKRVIDVTLAGVGIAVTWPLYPIIAAAIYAESPGPVFFRQRRAGRMVKRRDDGSQRMEFQNFDMFKFRTMRPDAEKLTGPVIAGQDDPRITKVGKFLRKTRLDEIPQMVNVLMGQMSVVGPRPERPELLENLALAIPFFEERMRSVKPGITGLAQVSLSYSGGALPGSEVEKHLEALTNPFKVDEAEGALADDMRIKLLYDLAYCASLEDLKTYLRTELGILVKTPLTMVKGMGR